MTQIAFYTETAQRDDLGLPKSRLKNLYVEKTPQGPGPFALVSRGGLGRRILVGSGPIRGIFRKPGAGNDGIFSVSGSGLFKRKARLASVPNTNDNSQVRWAASSTHLVVVVDGVAYAYTTGATASEITDTDLPAVSDVQELGGRFYFLEQDSDVIWFSEIGDPTDIDGLSFFSIESQPDSTVAMAVLSGEMVFFGEDGTDFYSQTGDPDAPLASAPGRSNDKGCLSRDGIVAIDNTLCFPGSDKIIYRLRGYTPERMSTNGIEELIRSVSDVSKITAFPLIQDGHAFYVLNLPDVGTYAYDFSTGKWCEFASHGEPQFRISCGTIYEGEAWLGDYLTGQLWRMHNSIHQDAEDPIVRVASAGYPRQSGRERCSVVMLECTRGFGTETGQSADPSVELRYTDDQGHRYSEWKRQKLGKKGDYTERAIWRNLGQMREPGRGFEIRATANVPVTFKYLVVNESWL